MFSTKTRRIISTLAATAALAVVGPAAAQAATYNQSATTTTSTSGTRTTAPASSGPGYATANNGGFQGGQGDWTDAQCDQQIFSAGVLDDVGQDHLNDDDPSNDEQGRAEVIAANDMIEYAQSQGCVVIF